MGGTYQARKTQTACSSQFLWKGQHKGNLVQKESEHNSGFNSVAVEAAAKTSILIERVQTLEDIYVELVRLGVEEGSRLEESRTPWQLYWEGNRIKEMQLILLQADIGLNLMIIDLLL